MKPRHLCATCNVLHRAAEQLCGRQMGTSAPAPVVPAQGWSSMGCKEGRTHTWEHSRGHGMLHDGRGCHLAARPTPAASFTEWRVDRAPLASESPVREISATASTTCYGVRSACNLAPARAWNGRALARWRWGQWRWQKERGGKQVQQHCTLRVGSCIHAELQHKMTCPVTSQDLSAERPHLEEIQLRSKHQ